VYATRNTKQKAAARSWFSVNAPAAAIVANVPSVAFPPWLPQGILNGRRTNTRIHNCSQCPASNTTMRFFGFVEPGPEWKIDGFRHEFLPVMRRSKKK